MTVSSSITLTMTTSQTETREASEVSIASNASYKKVVTGSYLYENKVDLSSSRLDINLSTGTDLLGSTLGFTSVYAVHLENRGASTLKLDGTYTTLPCIYGDVMIPRQGCIALHSVYGYAVTAGHNVISVNPGTNGYFTIRVVGV